MAYSRLWPRPDLADAGFSVEAKILLILAVTAVLVILIILNSPSSLVALAVMVVLVVLIMAINGAAQWLPQVLEKIRDLFR